MRVGDRCRVVKTGGHWVVIHVPSNLVVWARPGHVWEDALGFATGAGRKK